KGVPISTADSWDFWLQKDQPEQTKDFKPTRLGQTADFIGAHFLPYWLGRQVDYAYEEIVASQQLLQNLYPGKPILLAEVGWPSRGRERGQAQASDAIEGKFLRIFLSIA